MMTDMSTIIERAFALVGIDGNNIEEAEKYSKEVSNMMMMIIMKDIAYALENIAKALKR